MNRLMRDGTADPSRETKFSGTHGDRGMFIFPVQLTTSRIGNLTRLIYTLLYVMTIHTSLTGFLLLSTTAPTYIVNRLPTLSGHVIAYRWHSLPRVRWQRASSRQGSSNNKCCLFRFYHGPILYAPLFPHIQAGRPGGSVGNLETF